LTEEQETRIAKAFGARVLNAYGSREFGRVAFSCPEGNGLHFSVEDFFAEYLDLDPPDPGGLKRLVLTCFSNRAQPFVRYDTGDLVLPSEASACPCGRGLPLWKAVAGRLAERVVTPSGRHLSVHYLTLLLEDYESEIRQFQAVVDRPDRLKLLIIPTGAFKEETANRVESLLREQVGNGMEVKIERVGEIPVTGDGKRPLLRNLLGG
jgi:phenylacetate-CoA ligase